MGKLEEIADRIENVILGSNADSHGKERNTDRFSYSFDSGLAKAEKLRQNLLKKYENCDLKTETSFKTVNNDYGKTLYRRKAIQKSSHPPRLPSKEIPNDLKLIYGIGEARENHLKNQGYETVHDLVEHPRWGDKAGEISKVISGTDPKKVYNLLRRWKSFSNPLFFNLINFFRADEFAFVDIETMGLSNQPIFLLGLTHPKDGKTVVHQFLAADPAQELATLSEFVKHMDRMEMVLTYNGLRFDVPYIERRLAYYGVNWKFTQPHLDLYRFAKKTYGDRTANCKLGTLEQSILGIHRDFDIPSSKVPSFYQTYTETGNPGPLLPILSHHRQDMLSLADLLHELVEENLHGNR